MINFAMNYGNIKYYDIANGPGVRVTLFVSGCRNHCKGCFNKETWDFNYGAPFTTGVEEEIIKGLNYDYIAGFTLLGGEPFEPENVKAILPFVVKLRGIYPNKSFWSYSGYLYEDILAGRQGKDAQDLLKLFDVLVDGKFVEDLYDSHLHFRGSSNQRLINIKESVKENKVILWED